MFFGSAANLCFFILTIVLVGCGGGSSEQKSESRPSEAIIVTPDFNADSAFNFVRKQVEFGPRVPNTTAHQRCGDFLASQLRSFGFEVIEQHFTPTTFDGKKLNARNIIGVLNPESSRRILLAAHWDSRPYADEDPINKSKPVPGANDGASGVGVLLELARITGSDSTGLKLGVDIIFFDAEDWGNSMAANSSDEYMGYCLGSQYWALNKHKPNYSAYFGILLDMVGAANAKFPKEGFSMDYAGDIVNRVWETAGALGYGGYFISQTGLRVGVDDHVAVNKIARIPMIDIIHMEPSTGGFFEHWHTTDDTIEQIDSKTLKAVGQTVLQVLYEENQPLL